MKMKNANETKIESLLNQAGVAVKSVEVFGGHAIVTVRTRQAAESIVQWFTAAKFSRVRMVESIDAVADFCHNDPKSLRVFRVGCRMA
jgi:hypothetical protein